MPVTDRHPSVADMEGEWQKIRDVLAGPRRVKRRVISSTGDDRWTSPYIPRTPGQTTYTTGNGVVVDEYATYVQRAVLLPFAAPALNRMCGMVFRKAPSFELPEALRPQLDNLTLDGCTAEGFTWQVLRTAISTGFGAVLVDFSESLGRPYQRLYADSAVVNWAHTVVDGAPQLSRVVLYETVQEPGNDEFGSRTVEQYRVIELTGEGSPLSKEQIDIVAALPGEYRLGFVVHRLYRRTQDEHGQRTGEFAEVQRIAPTRRGQPVPFVPIVPFNPFGATWDVEQPPLSYLVDLILSHLRNSADYEQLLHECGAGTTLFGAGFSAADRADLRRVGGGSIAFAERPEAQLQYVQTSGAAGVELRQAMEDKKTEMGVAIGRLLLSQQKNVAESGAALELQFSGDDANLQTIAGSVAMAMDRALKMHVWWASTAVSLNDVTDVSVDLNDEFIVTRMDANELSGFGLEVDAGRMSRRRQYWLAQRGELTEPGVSFEDEQEQIASERAGMAGDPSGLDDGQSDLPKDAKAQMSAED